MEIKDLLEMKKGTVLQKGKRKRVVLGFDGMFVFYKTPSSGNKTTGEVIFKFEKWLKGAKVVED